MSLVDINLVLESNTIGRDAALSLLLLYIFFFNRNKKKTIFQGASGPKNKKKKKSKGKKKIWKKRKEQENLGERKLKSTREYECWKSRVKKCEDKSWCGAV